MSDALTPPAEWRVEFVLPNLHLRSAQDIKFSDDDPWLWPQGISLEIPYFSIAGSADARVQAIAEGDNAVAALIGGFVDEMGNKLEPSAFLVRTDAPEHAQTRIEAVTSFRNACALTFVLRARAGDLRYHGSSQPYWSDIFDLHPTVPAKGGRLATWTTAVRHIGIPVAKFRGMPLPYVAVHRDRLYPDALLFETLGKEWLVRFGSPPLDERYGRALFRSLELAYAACSAVMRNYGSVHDYGVQLALWVSAIEVLSYKRQSGGNRTAALDLLGEFRWDPHGFNQQGAELDARKFAVKERAAAGSEIDRPINAVQHAYVLMNRARNDFLHGNEVDVASLTPLEVSGGDPLPSLAAAVYRTALAAFLLRRHELPEPQSYTDEIMGRRFARAAANLEYEEALRLALGLEQRSPQR